MAQKIDFEDFREPLQAARIKEQRDALLAACKAEEAVAEHFRECRKCSADLSGNVSHCAEWCKLNARAEHLRKAAIAKAEAT